MHEHRGAAQRLGEPERLDDDGLVPLRHDQPGHLQRHVRHARAGERRRRARRRQHRALRSSARTIDRRCTPGTTYYFCAIASNSVRDGVRRGGVVHDAGVRRRSSTTGGHAASPAPRRRSTARRTRTARRRPAGSATATTNPGTCNDTFGTRAPATGGTDLGAGNASVAVLAGRSPACSPGDDLLLLRDRVERGGHRVRLGALVHRRRRRRRSTTLAATPVTVDDRDAQRLGEPQRLATTGWFRYATTEPGTCNDTFGTRVPATGGTGARRGHDAGRATRSRSPA